MYGKEEANALNKIWTLHKARASNEEHTAEWWQDTIAEFNSIAESVDGDKSCISHYCMAALRDIEDKSLGREFLTRCHVLSKDYTVEEFGEYLPTAQTGDILTVGGKRIEIK